MSKGRRWPYLESAEALGIAKRRAVRELRRAARRGQKCRADDGDIERFVSEWEHGYYHDRAELRDAMREAFKNEVLWLIGRRGVERDREASETAYALMMGLSLVQALREEQAGEETGAPEILARAAAHVAPWLVPGVQIRIGRELK